jgi:hypothetical protein
VFVLSAGPRLNYPCLSAATSKNISISTLTFTLSTSFQVWAYRIMAEPCISTGHHTICASIRLVRAPPFINGLFRSCARYSTHGCYNPWARPLNTATSGSRVLSKLGWFRPCDCSLFDNIYSLYICGSHYSTKSNPVDSRITLDNLLSVGAINSLRAYFTRVHH